MNEMRKLMEAVKVTEGWDPKLIAGAIFDEAELENSPLRRAADNSPEPYRAMIYEFGNLTGFYNPEAIDGSEIYAEIVDELERLSVEEDEYHNPIGEANQGGKTEHSGAKKGKGAYYGRKKEAKRDSNKNRRKADKAQTKEISEVTYADGFAYDIGTVNVRIVGDEVGLNHGHGENIFLSRDEFNDFVQGIKLNKLGEESLDEDKNSAALSVANARYAGLHKALTKLVDDFGNTEDFDGIYLLEALESLIERFSSLGEDQNDARGKMCPVCTGGRREGYGKDCPNCGGEGYTSE